MHAHKSHKYNAVTYDIEYDIVIGACDDQKLRLFKEFGVTPQ